MYLSTDNSGISLREQREKGENHALQKHEHPSGEPTKDGKSAMTSARGVDNASSSMLRATINF